MLEDQDSVSYTHWTLSQVSWRYGDLSLCHLAILDQPLLFLLQLLSWTGYVLREIKVRFTFLKYKADYNQKYFQYFTS